MIYGAVFILAHKNPNLDKAIGMMLFLKRSAINLLDFLSISQPDGNSVTHLALLDI